MIPLLFLLSVIVGGGGVSRFAPPAAHERIGAWARRESPSGDTGVLLEFPKEDLWLDREIARNRQWIDKLDGAGYCRGSALTGRLLPAAREASHLVSVSVSNHLLSAWYQRDTGKYERRLCVPVEVFALSTIL
jgi:hypothetical protein